MSYSVTVPSGPAEEFDERLDVAIDAATIPPECHEQAYALFAAAKTLRRHVAPDGGVVGNCSISGHVSGEGQSNSSIALSLYQLAPEPVDPPVDAPAAE